MKHIQFFTELVAPAMPHNVAKSAVAAALLALLTLGLAVNSAHAYFIVAGELVADMKASDLSNASRVWPNQKSTGLTVGDFTMIGAEGNLNVVENVTDGTLNVSKALFVAGVGNNGLRSAIAAPTQLLANSARSIEAWVKSEGTAGTQAVVSWGTNGGSTFLSSHNYSGGGNGLHSGWFNDTGWAGTGGVVPPITIWHHLAWTWDGQLVRGYTDGVLTKTFDLLDFNTASSLMTLGVTRNGPTDPFSGYIADVRVHTGVLGANQVMHNFLQGIGDSLDSACDFNGSGACDSADFAILRDNLFKPGTFAQGDIDLDGIVGIADYHQFKSDPNRIIGMAGAGSLDLGLAAVPEPASLVCLGVAAGLIVISARKRF